MRSKAAERSPGRDWKWIAAGAAVLTLIAAWHFLPVQECLEALEKQIDGLGVLGGILYGVVYVAGSLVFVPGSILGLGGGYLLGVGGGMVVVWIAVTAAETIAFLIARYLARRSFERLAKRHRNFAAIDEAVGKNGWKMVALLRLSAIIPFALSNYLLGLTSVRFVPYIVTSSLGMVPGIFFYVYLGAAGKSLSENGSYGPWEWAVLAAGFVATVAGAVIITRLVKKQLSGGRNRGARGSRSASRRTDVPA
jgi:uncharacterized membrane protein YdjX (TVP38/TMEM64 family)